MGVMLTRGRGWVRNGACRSRQTTNDSMIGDDWRDELKLLLGWAFTSRHWPGLVAHPMASHLHSSPVSRSRLCRHRALAQRVALSVSSRFFFNFDSTHVTAPFCRVLPPQLSPLVCYKLGLPHATHGFLHFDQNCLHHRHSSLLSTPIPPTTESTKSRAT